jgi:hypothetical protein
MRTFLGAPVIECLPGTLTPRIQGGATEQRSDVGGVYYTTVPVDPANHTAVTAVNTDVTVAGVLPTDQIVPIPPVTLEAGIAVQSARPIAANTVRIRTTNASAGAIDPASATWGLLVFRF